MIIPESVIKWAVRVAIATALTGQLPKLIYEIRIAELKLLQDTRASNWASPNIFGKEGFDGGRHR